MSGIKGSVDAALVRNSEGDQIGVQISLRNLKSVTKSFSYFDF